MGKGRKTPSDSMISPREPMIASLIVAIWLVAFALGYWEGRDVGSMLFN